MSEIEQTGGKELGNSLIRVMTYVYKIDMQINKIGTLNLLT